MKQSTKTCLFEPVVPERSSYTSSNKDPTYELKRFLREVIVNVFVGL